MSVGDVKHTSKELTSALEAVFSSYGDNGVVKAKRVADGCFQWVGVDPNGESSIRTDSILAYARVMLTASQIEMLLEELSKSTPNIVVSE